MYTHNIPTYARFQWLNHPQVETVLSYFLKPAKVGRKGYDKIYLFRLLIYKQLTGCSYRDLESFSGGIDYSTFIKFRKRLVSHNWFARVFKSLSRIVAEGLPLNLILDSSFVETYSGRKEQGSEYSGYYEEIGFKLHQIIDYDTRLPILQTTSPGARADVVWGKRLIRSAPRKWKIRSLTADRGYDSGDLVWQLKQKWRFCQVAIPFRKTNQKVQAGQPAEMTLSHRLKALPRTLDPQLLSRRTEIERYFSRKKRVMNLGEERTRHLKNFRTNCYLTAIMEILEWSTKPTTGVNYSPDSLVLRPVG